MHIRKGLSTDLACLECCDFSLRSMRLPESLFLNGDLHIEALTEPYLKTYELDLQTLENHCVNPDSIFLIAETDDGEIAGFITASCNWNKFISVDYIAVERSKRRTGAAHKLMSATHVWARSLNAPGLRLETQNVNVSACLFIVTMGLFSAVTIATFTTPCRKKMRSPFLVLHAGLRKYFISATGR